MRGKAERLGNDAVDRHTGAAGAHEAPIRHIKPIVDRVLEALSRTFARMDAEIGRPSLPPVHLLNVIDPGFDSTAFSHNKERLLRHEVARQIFGQVLEEAPTAQTAVDGPGSPPGPLECPLVRRVSHQAACGVLLPFTAHLGPNRPSHSTGRTWRGQLRNLWVQPVSRGIQCHPWRCLSSRCPRGRSIGCPPKS